MQMKTLLHRSSKTFRMLKLENLSMLIAKQFFHEKCHWCSLRMTGHMTLEAHGLMCGSMARCAGCVTSFDIKFGRWCQSAKSFLPDVDWVNRESLRGCANVSCVVQTEKWTPNIERNSGGRMTAEDHPSCDPPCLFDTWICNHGPQEVSCVLLGWLRRNCEEVFAARLDTDVHS